MNDHLRPNIFPALRYADADAGITFLEDAFGASEKAVHRDEGGVIQHAELALGAGLIMVGQHRQDARAGGEAPDPLASPISIYVTVEDPDAHHAVARAAGATVVREPEDMEYGSREYAVRDPEGNLWSFGTYDPYDYP